MDDELRHSLRYREDLRAAVLLLRAGRIVEALDRLEAAWLAGNENARERFFETLRAANGDERLAHAARLDRLACLALEPAERLWMDWFPAPARIVGRSAGMQKVRAFVYEHARSARPIVVLGESGVGHALVAHVVHELSGRDGFLEVNAAAITLTLFESEIRQVGEGQTLYVSYIDSRDCEDITLAVAQERHARLIVGSATDPALWSRSLDAYAGVIEIAPLRQRIEDLPVLTRFLLDRHGGERFAVTDELVRRLA